MNLREIIDAFVAVETGLEITDPYPTSIKRIYRFLAPGGNAIETPCFMHQYRRLSGSRIVGSRMSDFMIRVYLLIGPVEVEADRKSDICAAFDEVIIDAFDHDVMLGSTSAFQRITDEQTDLQPTPIDWLGNGRSYVGCWWDYKVTAHTNVAFS